MAHIVRKSPHYRRGFHSICNVCNAQLSQEDVVTHLTNSHCNKHFYQCHLCRNYAGSSRSSLFQHQKDVHNVSNYYLACPICKHFCSPLEEEVTTHLVNVHFRSEANFKEIHSHFVCVFPNCQTVCQNSMDLFKHYIGHHFPKLVLMYSCSECDYLFPKVNSLNQHKWDKHGMEVDDEDEDEETLVDFQCPMCSFTSFNRKDYKQHLVSKHYDYIFNCSFENCNYKTKLFWSLMQHTLGKHLSNTFLKYDCYVCEENSYSNIHSLIQHLRDKHQIDRFCSLCNVYVNDLSDHILSEPDHSYEIFECTICNEEYEEKDELIDHLSDKHVHITPLLRRVCYGD
ncbi:zinc finger protein 142 [Halyomorpha halys]|uniref:zinc finger protein 142 n=1 Tax=Halyomorpha halys TaxID=286706 RepID=UPI0006D5064D|nr:histone H4 transcription factor [Halyomorpha halys]